MRFVMFVFFGMATVAVLAFVFDGQPPPHKFAPLVAGFAKAKRRVPAPEPARAPPAPPRLPVAACVSAVLRVIGLGDSVDVVDADDREMMATPEGEAALRYLAERRKRRSAVNPMNRQRQVLGLTKGDVPGF